MTQYDNSHALPPAIELSQAFLMTHNMQHAANQLSATNGYFFQSDYVADAAKLSDSMVSITKLLGNLGPADKSTNYILE